MKFKFWLTQNIRKPDLVFLWSSPQKVNEFWRCIEIETDVTSLTFGENDSKLISKDERQPPS
jgi:hypothetical protein